MDLLVEAQLLAQVQLEHEAHEAAALAVDHRERTGRTIAGIRDRMTSLDISESSFKVFVNNYKRKLKEIGRAHV